MARKPKFDIRVGDVVLMGTHGISLPADWLFCSAIWIGDDEIATEHSPPSGGMHRQFWPLSSVRAYGDDYASLRAFRDQAHEAMKAEWRAVKDAEQAVVKARDAAWAKLDEIGIAVPARMGGRLG